jgi:hypothetical protein
MNWGSWKFVVKTWLTTTLGSSTIMTICDSHENL